MNIIKVTREFVVSGIFKSNYFVKSFRIVILVRMSLRYEGFLHYSLTPVETIRIV